MIVRNILKLKGSEVEAVTPETSIRDITATLSRKRIGAVIVLRQGRTICGMLSERDIVRGICEHGIGILDKTANDLMTCDVVTCGMDDTLVELMERMTDRRIRHLPVVERGELVGIISIGDVVKGRIAETEMEAQALKDYITTG